MGHFQFSSGLGKPKTAQRSVLSDALRVFLKQHAKTTDLSPIFNFSE